MTYADLFRESTVSPPFPDGMTPFPYQIRLAEEEWPDFLDVPTGMGKTAAVILSWLWKRGWRRGGRHGAIDANTPRRLVYCLPMRVLVEQTQASVSLWLRNLSILANPGAGNVSVHVLMGGADNIQMATWADCPEEDQILIGTQDMLLSRALMRGYAMRRYQWPVHFALLHNDAFWVFDEVQLMGPGLQTSAQLDAFRQRLGGVALSRSLWISATLNVQWLKTADHDPDGKRHLSLSDDEKTLTEVRRRREARKPLQRCDVQQSSGEHSGKEGGVGEKSGKLNAADLKKYLGDLASCILRSHTGSSVTLVILNTVERAQGVLEALYSRMTGSAAGRPGSATPVLDVDSGIPELVLIHSRFRAHERRQHESALHTRPPAAGRIVVATQAIEAGVDLSARVLFTELAPWASLVQRFGRCNRYGEFNDTDEARVYWIDVADPLPYAQAEIEHARLLLTHCKSAAPVHLPPVTASAPLYPVLRWKDFLDLFDTEPDLSGFDVDVAPYIRDADDSDVQVFWREFDEEAQAQPPAVPEEFCRASLAAARRLLEGAPRASAFAWDSVRRKWVSITSGESRLRPGMVLMLKTSAGGYSRDLGLVTGSRKRVDSVVPMDASATSVEAFDDDHRSLLDHPVRLSVHLGDVEREARALCAALAVSDAGVVVRAARWHDVGKAHPAFDSMIRRAHLQGTGEVLPAGYWAKSGRLPGRGSGRAVYEVTMDGGRQLRPAFRHELASALAWLALHGAEPDADLTAYLIAAHHGKVRMALRAFPGEQEPPDSRLFARGVWQGDRLPGVEFLDGESVPELELRLDLMRLGEGPQGPSWSARTQALLRSLGPFRLAWLEALVRIADWRASRHPTLESLASEADNGRHELDTDNPSVASAAAAGAITFAPPPDSAQRGGEHGVRGRAGESANAGTGTRPPQHATRYLETRLGVLSYTQLAPHLARNVQALEERIEDGEFADVALNDYLLLKFHERICGDLVPQLTGWRAHDVTVGAHIPPAFPRVASLVRDYGRDLDARIVHLRQPVDELWLECLAFAEGRLLSIHPFADFNGRVTRVWLRELIRRLGLPPVQLVPVEPDAVQGYLLALRAADRNYWAPLGDIWRQRIEGVGP